MVLFSTLRLLLSLCFIGEAMHFCIVRSCKKKGPAETPAYGNSLSKI